MKPTETEHVLVTKLLRLSSPANPTALEPLTQHTDIVFWKCLCRRFHSHLQILSKCSKQIHDMTTSYNKIKPSMHLLGVRPELFACTFHCLQTVQVECETVTWAALQDSFIFDLERFRKIYGSTSFTLSFIFHDVNFWTRLSPSGTTRSVKSKVYWQRCFLFWPAGTKHKTMLEARTGVGSIKSFPRPGVKSKLAATTKSSTGLQNKTFYCETCDVHVNSETQLKQVRPDKPSRNSGIQIFLFKKCM